MKTKEELVDTTWLSSREAELYIEVVEKKNTVRNAGKNIGMEEGQSTSTWSKILEKVRKSERTAELLDL